MRPSPAPRALEAAVARHLVSHPQDSTYALAKHLKLAWSTARDARARVASKSGGDLVGYLRKHPWRHREVAFLHPAPERWLARPPAPVSLSGEDAAAVEGAGLVPHRHLLYVEAEDLALLERSLRETGGEPVGPGEGNITLRVRDPYLIDDPPPLVERGQRLLDYWDSRTPHILRGLARGP